MSLGRESFSPIGRAVSPELDPLFKTLTLRRFRGPQDPGIQRRVLGSLRYEGRWYSASLSRAFTILTTTAP
jgi:hypothetical protein